MKANPFNVADSAPESRDIESYNPMDISNLISSKYASRILMCTYKKPLSVHQISKVFNIPIAVCYRKVNELEKLGFLRCTDRILNRKGKRVKLYQSQIVYAHFFFERDFKVICPRACFPHSCTLYRYLDLLLFHTTCPSSLMSHNSLLLPAVSMTLRREVLC